MVSVPVVSSPHLPHGYLGFLFSFAPPLDVGVADWEGIASSAAAVVVVVVRQYPARRLQSIA